MVLNPTSTSSLFRLRRFEERPDRGLGNKDGEDDRIGVHRGKEIEKGKNIPRGVRWGRREGVRHHGRTAAIVGIGTAQRPYR